MTVKELLQQGTDLLKHGGVPDAAYDAFCLLSYVTGIDHASYLADPGIVLGKAQTEEYFDLCTKRAGRIPLQHLTGVQGFFGLDFEVSADVLVPRYDTEALVETALEAASARSGGLIVDLGTGSGCIIVSLMNALKNAGSWRGIGIDLSESALALAAKNAARCGVDEMIHWSRSDFFVQMSCVEAQIIVSNPPYIPSDQIDELMPEVRLHEPRRALDGGADGLDCYRRIVPEAIDHLEPGGLLAVEIGFGQADDVSELFVESGYTDIRVSKDLASVDRVVSGTKKAV